MIAALYVERGGAYYGIDGIAAESRWILAVRAALPPGAPAERAAVVLWAAVGAWTDAPQGRWGALADAASDLADALDAGAGCARATNLRGTLDIQQIVK